MQNVIEIADGYVILGSSKSNSGPPPFSAYVAKINQVGDIVQSETFGDGYAIGSKILKVDDQKYILGGTKAGGQNYTNTEFWVQIVSDAK